LAAVLYFTFTRGAELSAPADAGEDFPARPEWYFLFLFRFLEFPAVSKMGVAFGAIYVPTALMIVVFLMPLIGRSKAGHYFNRLFLVAVLIAVAVLTGMTIMEDNHNESHQAKLAFAERDAHRVVVLAARDEVPQNGARELLVNDPYSQGPRLFARHCSSCHRYEGHDGTGQKILKTVQENGKEVKVLEPETATDLKDFGNREWITRVLTDYDKLFKPLENAGDKGKAILAGEMSSWCKDNQKALTDPANAESLKALVEFIAAQGGRKDLEQFDEKLVADGKAIFKGGTLKSGSLSSSCVDCHAMKVTGEDTALSDGAGAGYPTLTGYGGEAWLKAFLRNSAHADFYGDKNTMMIFDEKRLSDKELDLLVKWMDGDYYMPPDAHRVR
jgi:ubiquinol-cytochrome c reductase cytochrome b subunit